MRLFAGVLLVILVEASTANAAVLFQQDFSASAAVSSYAIASTPNNGQWNSISTSGTGVKLSITSGKLVFTRTLANAGSCSRTTDFSGPPASLFYKFDLSLSGTASAATSAGTWQVGSGFGTTNSTEADASTHSRVALNTTSTSGQFVLRKLDGTAANSSTFSGTQTIRWVINNSGGSLTYLAPDGTDEAVANDTWDLWVGTTKAFNDVPATTASQSLADMKFTLSGGKGAIGMDNFLIDPVPPVPIAQVSPSISDSSFIAVWSKAATATGYFLDVATDSGFTTIVSGYNHLDAGDNYGTIVQGLKSGTTYYYRVRAYTGNGLFSSGVSSTITVVTTAAPAQPTVLAASSVTSDSFIANWSAAAGATSYRLDVSTINNFSSFVSGYNNLTVNGTSQMVSGLNSGTTYYYRVRALNASGASANSGTMTVNTIPSAWTAIQLTSPGVINLRGYGIPGYSYNIQKSDASTFLPGNITIINISPILAAPDGVILFTDNNATNPQGYYRFVH